MQSPESNASRHVRHGVLILWPAFLAACLLQALVFALIDPAEVHWPGHLLQPTRQGVYTVAFFCFWLIGMACSGLVLWLAKPDQKPDPTVSGTVVG